MDGSQEAWVPALPTPHPTPGLTCLVTSRSLSRSLCLSASLWKEGDWPR